MPSSITPLHVEILIPEGYRKIEKNELLKDGDLISFGQAGDEWLPADVNKRENGTLEESTFWYGIRPSQNPSADADSNQPNQSKTIELQEFDLTIDGSPNTNANLRKTRKVDIYTDSEGIRIQLCKEKMDSDENPSVFIEATTQGFRVLTHANAFEEPFSTVQINDDGKHGATFETDNIPQTDEDI